MTDGANQPDDISEMMEKLWGPRRDGSSHDPELPSVEPKAMEATEVDNPGGFVPPAVQGTVDPHLQALRADVATLRSDLEARLLTPADLAEVRADTRDEMLQQLRLVLEEAAKHADEQTATMGDALRRQLEDVAGQVARAAGADEVAGIRQTVEVWSTDRVSRQEFDALQAELRDVVTGQMAAAHSQLQHSVGLLDAAITDARAQLTQRLQELAKLVSTEIARASDRVWLQSAGEVAPLRVELHALQARVQEVSAAVAALQHRPPAY